MVAEQLQSEQDVDTLWRALQDAKAADDAELARTIQRRMRAVGVERHAALVREAAAARTVRRRRWWLLGR
jgi:hypothetical protein